MADTSFGGVSSFPHFVPNSTVSTVITCTKCFQMKNRHDDRLLELKLMQLITELLQKETEQNIVDLQRSCVMVLKYIKVFSAMVEEMVMGKKFK
jgi:hypothetical protein